MKKTMLRYAAILLIVALLSSCDWLFDPGTDSQPQELSPLGPNQFFAQNTRDNSFYIVTADRLAEGVKCVVWAERGSGISSELARHIANEYDTIIRPQLIEAFSMKDFIVEYQDVHYPFADILDYANWLAGSGPNRDEGKLTILLLDIQDNFRNTTDPYVAGYFFSGDLLMEGRIPGSAMYSNGRDMIYIDTRPGLERANQDQAFLTLSHELQHLINHATGTLLRQGSPLDIWVDEGLASQAEFFYLGGNPERKSRNFSENASGLIARGNNFFVWDNHRNNPLAILDDYTTVYLFFRWLYLQASNAGIPGILIDSVTSPHLDHRAVTEAAARINHEWIEWEVLLKAWFAANFDPGNAVFGYHGDPWLQEIIRVQPISGSSIALFPGEGVYSNLSNQTFTPNTSTGSIRYAGLRRNMPILSFAPLSGDVLLTFNASINSRSTETSMGSLTGVAPSAGRSLASPSRLFTGPYVLDAGDVMGRDRLPPQPLSLQPRLVEP